MTQRAVRPAAEGECQSQISLATGHARVAELRARGVAEGRVLVARAEAEAVRLIADAVKVRGAWRAGRPRELTRTLGFSPPRRSLVLIRPST